MRKIVKYFARKTVLITLWALSLIYALAIIVPGYIADNAQSWLNSSAGQYALKSYISHKSSDLGYKTRIKSIHFALPQEFRASGITVSNGEHDIVIDELTLKGEHLSAGHMSVKLRYQGITASFKTQYSLENELLHLKNTSLNAPDLMVSAKSLTFDPNGLNLRGELQGALQRLSAYHALIGIGHEIAPLSFSAQLGKENGKQSADIHIRAALYHYAGAGLSLSDLDMSASLNDNKLTLIKLVARDGEAGTLNASGYYDLLTSNLDGALKIQNFHAPKQDTAHGFLDADLTVKGRVQDISVNGSANIKRLEITLPDRITGTIPELDIISTKSASRTQSAPSNIALDIKIHAPQEVFVRGWGLDAEFGGDLHVTGSAHKPYYDGGFSLLRGRYSEFGRNFKLKTASLLFAGQIPPEPRIDVLAETKVDDVKAHVLIKGQAIKPSVSFSSDPAMPEDQVLSYVLFGKTIEDISPFQAAQLAATLGRLSGVTPAGGGVNFDPIGTVRSAVGLDDLHVETDAEGGASVGAGKHIGDNIYIEVEAGSGDEGSSANIEIELTPNITLESEVGQDASGGAGIFWKWDY